MPETLTTGPFVVPAVTPGTNEPPITLLVVLSNPTSQWKSVTVYANTCPSSRGVPACEAPLPNSPLAITIPPGTCNLLNFSGYEAGDTLRVTIEGDIAKEAGEVEVSIVGRTSSGVHEPTMHFSHQHFLSIPAH
ncbi:hypothetical protein LOK74_07415 [Brevibacillus humidisoli]|uniref:hypothetical protein n=1 Tax=Brevibacillus humidisoli TaxID=2895522 RepID=UPI001E5F7773|nr:hypothetical protein [Brevibacillus humidisoli]UFJ42309.1 hypothetical protein LOK74_07415 [Brevibacillus humidisoli]